MQEFAGKLSNPPGSTLLVVAAESEAKAVAEAFAPRAEIPEEWHVRTLTGVGSMLLLRTGIGKANAAGAVTRALSLPECQSIQRVMNVGVAGLLPGIDPTRLASSHGLGVTVVGSSSVYADEGVETPDTFLTTAQIGFPMGPFEDPAVRASAGLLSEVTRIAGVVGPIATVSTCSGTNARAEQVRARTRAIAEAMEGAAVGHAVARWSQLAAAHRSLPGDEANAAKADQSPRALGPGRRIEFIEVRVISNTTGDRKTQVWDIPRALAGLTAVVRQLQSL